MRIRPAHRFWLLAALAASGCAKEPEKTAPSVSRPPVLQVVHPQSRKISRVVGQPSFTQSYERTSIYPKVNAFIEKWNVDIGDKVQKGDVLAELFVPEMREMWQTKKATVEYDKERVRLAQKEVQVASADVKAARARLDESRSILGKYQAEVERWDIQVRRLTREVNRTVVDPQILLEFDQSVEGEHRGAGRRAVDDRQVRRGAARLRGPTGQG